MQKEIFELHNLIKRKNIDKAYMEAKKLYKVDKSNKDLVKIITFLHIQKNQFNASIKVLKDYYQENPQEKDFDYFINMGVSLKSIEEYEEALSMYEEARKINPRSPLCYTVPAEIKLKCRKFKESSKLIDIALDMITHSKEKNRLHFANTIKLKTEVNVALNNDNQNEELLLNLLKDEFHPDLFYLLCNVNPMRVDTALLKNAEDHLKINDNKFQNKLDRFWYVHPLYFGLAIFYSRQDQKKSENLYKLANKEVQNSLRYNSFDYQKHIGSIIDIYKNDFSESNKFNDNEGENNIFILGTPRSGTSLIESFIASNNEVISGGELLSAQRLVSEYINEQEEKDTEEFVKDFRKNYLNKTNYLRGQHKYILDKLPENFCYLGYLCKILPKSKIIRTFRDPWDVAVSLFKQRYVTNIPYSASFFNIGVFMSNFEAINIFWTNQSDIGQNLIDIKYEELVSDPILYQKKLYDFIGINAEFSEEKRRTFFSQTASIRQIGSIVHKKSVKKEEFLDNKEEFYDALKMQRRYWEKRGIKSKNDEFFGYKIM